MPPGEGYTSRVLVGLAVLLDTAGVGDWDPNGTYSPTQTGILIRAVPPAPDRIITLAAYPVGTDLPGMADHTMGVQIRVRGIPGDPLDCDDLADAVFEALDSRARTALGDVPVIQAWRQSYTSLGDDSNGRWSRSENYYVQTMRPTAHRTD